MILLDTNVVSELMRSEPERQVVNNVKCYSAESVFISAITHAEILQGIALLPEGKRKQRLAAIAQQVLALFDNRTLPFDRQSLPFYAAVIQQRSLKGRPIDFPDAQIAAIAIQYGFTLFTRNTRDFEEIEGLILSNPWL